MHFSRAFQRIFRSVALVTKKLWAILDCFSQTGRFFFRPVPYHINLKKKYFLTKNPLNYYSLKVTKLHGDSVQNESAKTKNYSLFRVTGTVDLNSSDPRINDKNYRRFSALERCKVSRYPPGIVFAP